MQPFSTVSLNRCEQSSILVSGITIYCGLFFISNSLNNTTGILLFVLILFANIIFLKFWMNQMIQSIMEVIMFKSHKFFKLFCSCYQISQIRLIDMIAEMDLSQFKTRKKHIINYINKNSQADLNYEHIYQNMERAKMLVMLGLMNREKMLYQLSQIKVGNEDINQLSKLDLNIWNAPTEIFQSNQTQSQNQNEKQKDLKNVQNFIEFTKMFQKNPETNPKIQQELSIDQQTDITFVNQDELINSHNLYISRLMRGSFIIQPESVEQNFAKQMKKRNSLKFEEDLTDSELQEHKMQQQQLSVKDSKEEFEESKNDKETKGQQENKGQQVIQKNKKIKEQRDIIDHTRIKNLQVADKNKIDQIKSNMIKIVDQQQKNLEENQKIQEFKLPHINQENNQFSFKYENELQKETKFDKSQQKIIKSRSSSNISYRDIKENSSSGKIKKKNQFNVQKIPIESIQKEIEQESSSKQQKSSEESFKFSIYQNNHLNLQRKNSLKQDQDAIQYSKTFYEEETNVQKFITNKFHRTQRVFSQDSYCYLFQEKNQSNNKQKQSKMSEGSSQVEKQLSFGSLQKEQNKTYEENLKRNQQPQQLVKKEKMEIKIDLRKKMRFKQLLQDQDCQETIKKDQIDSSQLKDIEGHKAQFTPDQNKQQQKPEQKQKEEIEEKPLLYEKNLEKQ